jgi:hypothetical protein
MNTVEVHRGHGPLLPIQSGIKFIEKLKSEGLESDSTTYTSRLDDFLQRLTTKRCTGFDIGRKGCGAYLRFYESGGVLCETCWTELERAKLEPLPQHQGMAKIGVPLKYQHCTLAAWRGTVDSEIVDWAAKPQESLLIYGATPGIGKTHLATAALYSASIGTYRSCWWASAAILSQALADETFLPEKSQLQKSRGVGLLLIDDFATENNLAPRAAELLHALIDYRFSSSKATIVTTNLTPQQCQTYNPRIASRLFAGAIVELTGEDQRSKLFPLSVSNRK